MNPGILHVTRSLQWKRSGWAKAAAVACTLAACEPFPVGTGSNPCEDIPSCAGRTFEPVVNGSKVTQDSVPRTYRVDGGSVWIRIEPTFSPPPLARTGTRGQAYALSCLPCSGPQLEVDSLYFTTDVLPLGEDTIKSGFNLATGVSYPGFSANRWYVHIQSTLQPRFRDSIFEVRFTGSADGVPKSGSATLRITNPTLLMP